MEERLRVGVVGLHEGATMLLALRSSGLCRAIAGCDPDESKRQHAREINEELRLFSALDEMLDGADLDLVCIYTPDSLHAAQIEQCMRAGMHVLCTKPLINDPHQAARLLAVASETGKRLQVGQSTRFYEPFQRQREHYLSGKLGDAEVIDAHYNHRMDWYYTKSPWTISETHWAYLGLSHPIDYVRWYLGRIREVHAYGTVSELGKAYNMPTPDAIVVNLISETGKIARVLGNYGFHELPKARALIEGFLMGSKGSSLARYPDLRFTYHDETGVEVEEDYHHSMAGYYYRHELKGMHYGEFCNCIDSFAASIRSGEPNSPDLVEGIDTVLTMRAVVESLETGKPTLVQTIG
ncbi:MAG TPA: Gfo/Idh/MocA family oxidoreductase [Fimbriimonadaceae bacterium]|nr:Gfo/Idh/MocA family oxidoreductase [Fimbriimonadaceae bacterium]